MLFVYFLSIALFFLSKYVIFENTLSLAFGLVSFVFIPGYFLTRILNKKITIDVLGFSFLLGFGIQIFCITIYDLISVVSSIDFQDLLIMSSIISIFVLKVISHKLGITHDIAHIKDDFSKLVKTPLVYLFIFALVSHLIYASYNSASFLPDSSLYFDVARNLVLHGTFGSHVINDELSPYDPYFVTNGFLEHKVITYVFAIFFYIHDISFKSAQLAVWFASSLLVYPVYYFTKKLFNSKVAIVASGLAAIHPIFFYFSAITYGPEIFGLVFLVTALYLIMEGIQKRSYPILVTSGILLAIANEMWWALFYITLPIIPLLFYAYDENQNGKFKKIIGVASSTALLFLYAFALKVFSLVFIWIPVALAESVLLPISIKLKARSLSYPISIFAAIIFVTGLPIIKEYLFPKQVTAVMSHAVRSGIGSSVLHAFTLYFVNFSLNGVVNFFNYAYYHITPVILFLFLLYFFKRGKLKEKIIVGGLFISNLILISMSYSSTYPDYLYSAGRYLLLPTTLAIIGSSYLIVSVFESISLIFGLEQKSFNLVKRFRNVPHNVILNVTGILAIFCVILVLLIPQYSSGIVDIKNQDLFSKYGWSDKLFAWLDKNTTSSDVLLSDRAREMSWLADRNVVNIRYQDLKLNETGFSELDSLIGNFDTKYMVVDRYFHWTFPKLDYFYPLSLNSSGTVLLPQQIAAFSSSQNGSLYGYESVFSDSTPNGTTSIWKILRPSDIDYKMRINGSEFDKKFSSGNGGKISIENNTAKLEIGNNRNYTYVTIKNPEELQSVTENQGVNFFAWSINDTNEVTIKRVELWSKQRDEQNLLPPTRNGVWATRVNLQEIDDMRIVISGTSNGYLTINWLSLGNIRN